MLKLYTSGNYQVGPFKLIDSMYVENLLLLARFISMVQVLGF